MDGGILLRFKRFAALLLAMCLLAAALPTVAVAASKYYITVDVTNQVVTVYESGNVSDSGIVRQMICTTGAVGTPTPIGTFSLPAKSRASERTEWYYFPEYNCYAKWATRIRGGVLFHSVLYTAGKVGPTKSSLNALGSRASHGCVRLRVADAKWIALNCPAGTKCRIYNSGKTNASLRKLLKKRTFVRADQTYESFLKGLSPSDAASKFPLKSGSKGDKVIQLQKRLTALGFYAGSADGKLGSSTVTAVKAWQKAAGVKQTGTVDEDAFARIVSDDSITGTAVTLTQGMKGPAVAVLQKALKTLKLYEGSVDGDFGSGTLAAVKAFQQNFGYTVNGKATAAQQNAAIKKADEVAGQFGDADYQLAEITVEVQMAKVKVKTYLTVRKTASTKAAKVASLKNNARVKVLEDKGTWVKIQTGTKVGYVKRSYLVFYTEEQTVMEYVPVTEPTVEPTEEPTAEPTTTPEISIPTDEPSEEPTLEPTEEPSIEPSEEPTSTPEIFIPTDEPSEEPTPEPSEEPSAEPTAPPAAETETSIPEGNGEEQAGE